MNVRTSVLRGFALLALSSLTLTACDDKTPTVVTPPAVVVTVAPQNATLTVGQTAAASAAVSNAANTAVTWTSNNAAVATVSNAGVITAVAPGTAVITAASVQDPNARAFVTVTVNAVVNPIINIDLVPEAASVTVGGTVQLVPIVTGTNNTGVTYRSSATGVATVSTTGLVTGVAGGTAVITAMANADTTQKATSTITVTTGPIQTPVITITPTTATANIGQTVQYVVNVANSANTAYTCRSSAPAIATVDNNCLATAVSNGVAIITAISSADTTRRVTAQLNVAATVQPSLSIQAVTQPNGAGIQTPVPVNSNVAGVFNTTMNVTAGSQTSITSVEVRLNGVTCNTQTFNPPLAPTENAQIITTCNTAQLNAMNTPVFPNGAYTLTAVAINANGAVVATATYGTLNLLNVNGVQGVVTFDNTLNDADNDSDDNQVVTGGVIWNGGSATVVVTPAIFTGIQAATVPVSLDMNCDGTPDGATRNATIGANGTGTVTFSEGATGPLDGVEDATVCFVVGNGTDAQGLPVAITNGSGNLTAVGTTGNPSNALGAFVGGATQTVYSIDNVQPNGNNGYTTAITVPTAVLANNNYAGGNTAFTTATVPNSLLTDGGVGGVTTRFFAVAAGTALATQADMAAAVAGSTAITSAAELASSTISNSAYRLIAESKDALGNVTYSASGTFGVDLEIPTIMVGNLSIAQNGTINTMQDVVVAVTDTFSGPISLQFRGTVHSVLEVDGDAGTEVRCVTDAVGTVAMAPASGVCPMVTLTPLTNIGGQTEQGTIVIPNPAADANEGYYVIEVMGQDRAGNMSSQTLSFTTLRDVTAPTAVINIKTENFPAGTVALTGQVRDNVDLASYDTRFTYPGLANVPDDIPFVSPVTVDSYGLPLTGVVDVNATSSTAVRDITDQAGVTTQANAFGFGASDVAANYSFTGTGLTAGAGGGLVGSFLNGAATDFDASFVARADAAGATNVICLDRSGNGGGGCPASATVFAQVRVGPTSQNPVNQVNFYMVNPGPDNAMNTADDFNVLIGTSTTTTVVTGISDRTFTFSAPINANILPRIAANTSYPVFAVAISTNGSAVLSDVLTANVQD